MGRLGGVLLIKITMNDKNSFEDRIKHKMEEFNDVPSPKVWQQLEQHNYSNYSTQKSFIMKGTLFSIAAIILLSSIFFAYQHLHGNTDQQHLNNDLALHEYLVSTQNNARKESKNILVKITMEGCTFCGKMEKETILDEEVQKAIKDDFLTLDMDIKDPNYKSFFEHYNISATPIYLFLTPDGDILSKVVGYRPKDIFLEGVELALENNISKNYIPIEQKKPQQHTKKTEVKESETLKIKAFPNPSNGNFKLDIQGEKGMGIIQFVDINGRFLLKEKIADLELQQTLEFDFSNQNQTIIATIKQGENIATEKVIIQK